MAEGRDSLRQSITNWLSDSAKARAGSAAEKTTSRKFAEIEGMPNAKQKAVAGSQMGLDPEIIKQSNNFFKDSVKLNSILKRIILEQAVNYGQALEYLEKIKIAQLGISKGSELQTRRELKVLSILKQQYMIQRKRAAIQKTLKGLEPTIGKTSAGMLKYALLGGGGPGGPGGPGGGGPITNLIQQIPIVGKSFLVLSRILAGIGGVVLGTVIASFSTLNDVVRESFDQLNVAFTGGIQGVLTASKNIMDKGFKLLSKVPKIGGAMSKMGGTIGAIANVMISEFMFKLEDEVARSKAMVRSEARTGATMKESGAAQERMMGVTDLRGRTQEWLDALSDTGTIGKAGQRLESSFYRMGQTMALSAAETGQYFNQMLSMSGDTTVAMKDMGHMFQVAKDSAKKTTMSTIELTKAISDASLNARMLNVDSTTVANTMGILADKQKILGQFGVDLKTQGPGILKTLTGMGQGWDMATHSFAGMLFYGKKYQEQTGKQLDIGKAYMMSRYGEKGGMGFKMGKEGTWEMGGKEGAKAFQIGSGEMSERLQKIQEYTIAQTKHIQNDGERMMAQKMLLKDIFKINDENAQTAIMTTKKSDFKKLADSKQMQMAMMSQEEISSRTLSVQERSEGVQRKVLKLINSIMMLIVLLPFKLADLLGEIPGFGSIKKTKVFGKTTIEDLGQGFNNAISGVVKNASALAPLITAAFVDPGKRAVEGAKKLSTRHYGGLLRANELAKLQYGEGGKLGNDEFMFMGSKPMDVISRPDMSEKLATGNEGGANISNVGSTTYISITVPSANPDEIADALRQHLAKLS